MSGYTEPLYILPFDHRHSYVAGMFHAKPPLTPEQIALVIDSKRVIYQGFERAVAQSVPLKRAGILVDEEFGAAILRDARASDTTTALSVEKSGSDEFEFEYGADFAEHIEAFKPDFAKVLVRFNPEDDREMNARQSARLAQLSDYCRKANQKFMFELLVPATKTQSDGTDAAKDRYDAALRPDLMVRSIQALQEAGVEPDVWKIEGLAKRGDCERILAQARHGGRSEVSCIVLGRGADETQVERWLQTAASVPGFIGFAVGRTTFWDAVEDYVGKKVSRDEAIARVAERFEKWVSVFEAARDVKAVNA